MIEEIRPKRAQKMITAKTGTSKKATATNETAITMYDTMPLGHFLNMVHNAFNKSAKTPARIPLKAYFIAVM